ncbi:Hypothetical protein SRAE_X000158200 [Strongyloides ratti]|uniref:K Homology domain-containing protein n=1 Tax=Strongyloides ratti TaxID=34506 RepID=A0A090KQM7_STRRB|nr:Hypothetical protein SRAE_X000158200 [Strongyloides ratti]CEF59838.1 Hypothetical protein SRAE_X000158200 [Strongyloides ratti]
MVANISSIINNSNSESTFGINEDELSVRTGYWIGYENYNCVENNIYVDEEHLEHDPSLTTFYNDFMKMSIIKAYGLPILHQRPLERFHKIVSAMILLEKKPINYLTKLTGGVLIIKAYEIIKKIWDVESCDEISIKKFDIQIKEIEVIFDKMAYNAGFKKFVETSTKILCSPQRTIVNMVRYQDLCPIFYTDPVVVYDGENISIKKTYNCLKRGGFQFKMTKKIYFDNVSNVNIFGRILGPSGSTLRTIEKLTKSRMHLNGSKRANYVNKCFIYPYLTKENAENYVREPLHLLIEVYGNSEVSCYRNLETIKKSFLYALSLK